MDSDNKPELECQRRDGVDWLESIDRGTYDRLIFQSPEVIDDGESLDERLDRMDQVCDDERRGFWESDESSPGDAPTWIETPSDKEPTLKTWFFARRSSHSASSSSTIAGAIDTCDNHRRWRISMGATCSQTPPSAKQLETGRL